ncbi:MAG: hypothetical protein AB7J46_06280 [Candidatus Altimarinota bacterium]
MVAGRESTTAVKKSTTRCRDGVAAGGEPVMWRGVLPLGALTSHALAHRTAPSSKWKQTNSTTRMKNDTMKSFSDTAAGDGKHITNWPGRG